MKLDRLILVNWGQLRPGNFEMGDMTLLTGETGSGKSTMLDALQTVMTAAFKGVMNYNPGQDEVSQGQRRGKTKRTLESYIVGAEYNNFSRSDGAQGFMAAVFRPSKGEENLKPFTALVAASARVEGSGETRQPKLESMSLVIVDDAALTFEDFMRNVETNECMPADRIARHLQTKYSKVNDFYDKKADYLCALYGRFRGKTGVTKDEATNAAKAWVQSIAYRPIGSVHELVRDEILDFDEKQLQQDVERISGLMRQVSNLRQKSLRLKASVSKLTELQTCIQEANKAHEDHVMQGMLVAKLQLKADDDAVVAKEQLIAHARQDQRDEQEKIASWRTKGASLDTKRVNLTARLQGIAVHSQKVDLETKLARATREARVCLESLDSGLRAAGLMDQKTRDLIARPIPDTFKDLKDAINRVDKAHKKINFERLAECADLVDSASRDADLDIGKLQELVTAFKGVNESIEALHEALLGQERGVMLTLTAETVHLGQGLTAAEGREKDLDTQRARLATGKVTLPMPTERALQILNHEFPEANTQVLCDLVEPKSQKWQSAIEGYLGGARFNLIVDPAWERRCVDHLKAHKITAKVVQGALCMRRAERKQLQADSIVNELQADNPIAWAYLVDQFGSVVKAANTEALRDIERGVTLDGIASGSRTMFTVERVTNVFGTKAREDALDKVTRDLELATAEVTRLRAAKTTIDAIKGSLQSLRPLQFNAAPLREASTDIHAARDALASLDITELKALQAELDSVNEQIRVNNQQIEQGTRRDVGYDSTIRNAESAIGDILSNKQAHLRELEAQIQKVKHLITSNPRLVYQRLMDEMESQIADPSLTIGSARSRLESLAPKPDDRLFDVREALAAYNSHAENDDRFVVALQQRADSISFASNYEALVSLEKSVIKTLENLRGVGLYNSSKELDEAEKSFHDVFTKQFCVEIKSRVDEGVRTLRQMNHELKNLKFGADSFHIDYTKYEPEFEDYLSFFTAVTQMADSAEPVDLFGDSELSEKHAFIRDRLVKLLLDEDQDKATKELLRIADYRNYRRYDIINETTSGSRVRLSEWGTGSGGQLETPAYIVRAAVVTNRLKLFEKGGSLKLLVNDESFAKMDEPRARAVLGFLKDKLDLQIISAMPTMKAGALKDEFNREYSFTRLKGVVNGELDFVSECDERIFKSDKMRELWERQRVVAREKAKHLFDAAHPEEAEEPIVPAESQ